jgi:hypothetical protein
VTSNLIFHWGSSIAPHGLKVYNIKIDHMITSLTKNLRKRQCTLPKAQTLYEKASAVKEKFT